MIPYGKQTISEEDIQSVVKVLQSDFLTQGPIVPLFENHVAQYCGSKYAIAVNSATSALHLACLALGVEPNDFVWTSPITFVATSNAALYCEAKVDFVDIDPKTYNLCPKALEKKLAISQKDGTLPKVVIPVHLSGQSADMEAIHALSKKYHFRIIEDASHAIGAKYYGQSVGNCRYSDITIFSFHPVKIITTGEGGMALTNNQELARHMVRLRSHGITRDENEMTQASEGPWYYQQLELGYNYRMTDIQAALGLSQMKKLNIFVTKRHEIAERYNDLLADLPITVPVQDSSTYSAMHLYVIRLQLSKINKTHLEVFNYLRSQGIGVNVHYIPVYKQPYYRKLGFKNNYCPEAEKYYAEAITLPIYPSMTDDQQDKVVAALKDFLKNT